MNNFRFEGTLIYFSVRPILVELILTWTQINTEEICAVHANTVYNSYGTASARFLYIHVERMSSGVTVHYMRECHVPLLAQPTEYSI